MDFLVHALIAEWSAEDRADRAQVQALRAQLADVDSMVAKDRDSWGVG